jgi:hypothetical protein
MTERRPARHHGLRHLLTGPLPALPRALDRLAEAWAARPPRVRAVAVVAGLLLLVAAAEVRVHRAEQRWGGAPVPVLVAQRDMGVGEPVDGIRRRALPPRAVPPAALAEAPAGARLALALPQGAVLTAAHVDPRGPAAGLPAALRAVPVAIEDGWGVVAGAWVDVWVLGDGGSASRLVARSRPVLEVRDEQRPTALVGLAGAEVEAVTTGIAGARLLLAHAPPPGGAADGARQPP